MAVPVLPPSAPFTIEQRAWLNGFFAAVFSTDAQAATPTNGVSTVHGHNGHSGSDANGNALAALNGVSPAVEPEAEESYPWHDSALSLDERMTLAEGKPIKLRLMAAMAQLDCGQCGYLCKTYAEAIADGSEKSLRKCVPGEKPTTNKLKKIMATA